MARKICKYTVFANGSEQISAFLNADIFVFYASLYFSHSGKGFNLSIFFKFFLNELIAING